MTEIKERKREVASQDSEIDKLIQKVNLLEGQVVKNAPGRTSKLTHQIRKKDSLPIRQKPYRVPQAYPESE